MGQITQLSHYFFSVTAKPSFDTELRTKCKGLATRFGKHCGILLDKSSPEMIITLRNPIGMVL